MYLAEMPREKKTAYIIVVLSDRAFAMAFAGAHNADASHGTFNDVGQNQYNCIFQLPPLRSAFSVASSISSAVQHAESSREQLQGLAVSIHTLLRTLDAEYGTGRLSETDSSFALENLNVYVEPAIPHDQDADHHVVYLIIFTHLCKRRLPPIS
jgi:hypothetical protein